MNGMKAKFPFSTSLSAAFCTLFLMTGVASASSDDLFVTDGSHGIVYRYKPNGERQTFAFVFDVTGLAFNAAGDLYVTDYNESIIYKVGGNNNITRFASGRGVPNPSALAFDSSGNLFVSVNGAGPGITKIAPDGSKSIFVKQHFPKGLAFDSAGNLFAVVNTGVLKYAPDGTETTFAIGFFAPVALAFDSDGYLFVSDLVAGVIYKISPDGTTTSAFATDLSAPQGLAFDSSGNLFVADGFTVLKFTPDGTKSTFATGIIPVDLAFRP